MYKDNFIVTVDMFSSWSPTHQLKLGSSQDQGYYGVEVGDGVHQEVCSEKGKVIYSEWMRLRVHAKTSDWRISNNYIDMEKLTTSAWIHLLINLCWSILYSRYCDAMR